MRRVRQPDAENAGIVDVTVVLLEAGYASTAIAPIEVFHSAGVLWNSLRGENAAPRFRVRTASIDGAPVTSLCALGLTPQLSVADIKRSDIVILSASGLDVQDRIAGSAALMKWLRDMHKRGAYVAGICSGAAFLAASGLLDGRKATTHWGVVERLRQRYPKVRWQSDHFVTEDNRLLCSGGVYSSIDLSLYLVEKFCGHQVALQCANALLVNMPRSRQSGYAAAAISRPHADAKIKEAEEYLRANYVREISIDDLSKLAGMGPRNFIRRFKSATGCLPRGYIQTLRIQQARSLLEREPLPIQSICARIGYDDIAFFRSLFKRHTGMTPVEYRGRFAPARLSAMRTPAAAAT